jgi:hypothetical protein
MPVDIFYLVAQPTAKRSHLKAGLKVGQLDYNSLSFF